MTDDDFFKQAIRNHSPDSMQELVKNKALFYRHCLEQDLPTAPIISSVVGSHSPAHISEEIIPQVRNLEQWKMFMRTAPAELFVKPIDGSHGQGAFTVHRIGEQYICYQEGKELGFHLEQLYHYFLDKLKNEAGLLIQPRLRSHHELLEISSASGLATARVVTAMVNRKARALLACARLSVGSNICDNFSEGASGNLVAAIDIETGMVGEAWSSSDRRWPTIASSDRHPDTGKRIVGFTIPSWPDVIQLAVNAQNSLPGLRSVGWDIAITDGGPILVEANGGYGIDILQIGHQRGLGRELIPYVRG